MKSSYKPLGDYIRQVKLRNSDLSLSEPMGINISKFFMPSVANTNGTDLSKYRVVKNGQFAYNPMHVGRDEVLPIALLKGKNKIIVSPAYTVFEIIDEQILLPEYLMMWFRRKDFDRNAWFTTDNSVRGGFSWESLCNLEMPIPSPQKQREKVTEYNTVVNRIKLNEELNLKLEETAQTLYKHWFVDFEFPISVEYAEAIGKPELEGKPYKSNGGEMVYWNDLGQEIPKDWKESTVNQITSLCKRGITPKYINDEGLVVINQRCVRNNSIDFGFSRRHDLNYKSVSSERYLQKFDVLVNSTGTGTLGRVGLVKELCEPMTVDTHVTILRVNNNCMPLWFWYTIASKTREIEELAEGTTGQTELSRSNLEQLKVLLPPIEVQEFFNSNADEFVKYSLLVEKEQPVLNNLKSTILQRISMVEEFIAN